MAAPAFARPLPWVVVTSALLLLPSKASAGNGDPASGYPNWHERATLAFINACRQGPTQYRDAYLTADPNILQPTTYPAQPPLYYCLPLNQAARFHSEDMLMHGCFSHNSCDGTPWYTRVASFYSEPITGENIASPFPTPFAVVNAWLSDGHAPDGLGDGHRAQVMSGLSTETGIGYATYWTQDFGGGTADYATPLVWGSHAFVGDGNVTFLANYYAADALPPQAAVLFVDDVPYEMQPAFGTAARGTYKYALSTSTACRTYYFRFLDAAGVFRVFPETGRLRTFGEGGCTEDYLAMPVDVAPEPDSRPGFGLEPPTPNPARSRVLMRFTLPGESDVALRVVDLAGRVVGALDGRFGAGRGEWAWDGIDPRGHRVPDGVYFVQIAAAGRRATQRLVVLDAH